MEIGMSSITLVSLILKFITIIALFMILSDTYSSIKLHIRHGSYVKRGFLNTTLFKAVGCFCIVYLAMVYNIVEFFLLWRF